MNIDKKLELAHEWAMEFVSKNKDMSCASNMVSYNAWQYADAMEAEYNKRKQAEDKNKREAVRKLLNDSGTFIEREGQHFDDLNTADSPQLDFQVDWSVAPVWANWWAMDDNGDSYWHSCVDEPFINESIFEVANPQGHTFEAPSFDYQGDWKDSLRKRP